MCACRQKKSFLIDDILNDVTAKKRTYRSLSNEPTAPFICLLRSDGLNYEASVTSQISEKLERFPAARGEGVPAWNVLEQRRHTYPLCSLPLVPVPRPVCAGWLHEARGAAAVAWPREPRFDSCCDPSITHAFTATTLQHGYPLDTGPHWWGGGSLGNANTARRAGRQARFTAAQATALEQKFAAARYLCPEQRRRLAQHLRLTDRQVKTWFQNRRAKWRRATCFDESSRTRERQQESSTVSDSPRSN